MQSLPWPEGREENVLRASFFASCALTSKGALKEAFW